ncbi:MAG: sulfite exporter TauE/SafE family protein [Bacteroidetes bacterium]|jgi:uncharacterized membrane protein YfcA|nr:sulfite exporter TauE/SafE family protein [Bacteroidota bacterium]
MVIQIALFIFAGFAGGAVNAVAGGAKLFVFPMLLAAGMPPLVANATGTIALWPALIPAAWILRVDLAKKFRTQLKLVIPALLGALCGAFSLIWSTESLFLITIPFLLILALGAILLGDRAVDITRRFFPADRLKSVTGILLFAIGFYGGYFGAGMGFMLIAVLSVASGLNIRQANASKILFAFCINLTAVIPLTFSGLVDWTAAGSVLIGGLLGGYFGAKLTRVVSQKTLRLAILALGVILIFSFLIRMRQ